MEGLPSLASDARYSERLLTKVAEVIASSQRLGDFGPLDGITSELEAAELGADMIL